MVEKIKKWLYFPIASYFKFWAGIRLGRWRPRVIVVTGSSGKTTLLHLIESQLGDKALYSHHANSSYGIPFDVLSLHRKSLTIWEWPYLFFAAPFYAFRSPPKTKLYVVEADCDRPREGKFLGEFLKPEVTLWVSLSKTHSMNFPEPVETNIAHEFGYFVQNTRKLVIANGDSDWIQNELNRSRAQILLIHKKDWLEKYNISKQGTQFTLKDKKYSFNYLLPEETFYSILMCLELMHYLQHSMDPSFSKFPIPPGRSSLFAGIKNTTIIDSTYNATPASVKAILSMFDKLPAKNKWAIISDMTELGSQEVVEHKKLGKILSRMKLDKVILMGPRTLKYTYPELAHLPYVKTFLTPVEVLDYLQKNLKGGELLLFKGARFLEGVIAHLLADSNDIAKLPRREKVWEIRRKQWGL